MVYDISKDLRRVVRADVESSNERCIAQYHTLSASREYAFRLFGNSPSREQPLLRG